MSLFVFLNKNTSLFCIFAQKSHYHATLSCSLLPASVPIMPLYASIMPLFVEAKSCHFFGMIGRASCHFRVNHASCHSCVKVCYRNLPSPIGPLYRQLGPKFCSATETFSMAKKVSSVYSKAIQNRFFESLRGLGFLGNTHIYVAI